MTAAMLAALLKAAEANPQSFIGVLQMILDILKANPELLAELLKLLGGHSAQA